MLSNKINVFLLTAVLMTLMSFPSPAASQGEGPNYDFSLSTQVNISGMMHFQVNYFPDLSPPQYTYYPNLDNPYYNYSYYTLPLTRRQYRFSTPGSYVYTLTSDTTDTTPPFVFPPPDQFFGSECQFFIDSGVTVTIRYNPNLYTAPAFIVKAGGTIILDPNSDVYFTPTQLVLEPGSSFISQPNPTVNHTIAPGFNSVQTSFYRWIDPWQSTTFLCLGCNITMISSDGAMGVPGAFVALFDDIFLCATLVPPQTISYFNNGPKTFLAQTSQNDYFQLDLFTKSNLFNNSGTTGWCYDYHNKMVPAPNRLAFMDYTNLYGTTFVYHDELRNVRVTPVKNIFAMTVTGPANVVINGVYFSGVGITSPNTFQNSILNPNGTATLGKNIADRYGINLLHVQRPVSITNCVFTDQQMIDSSFLINFTGYLGNPPLPSRFLLAAKRSYGIIAGNSFILRTPNTTAIGLLHGTESFYFYGNSFTTNTLAKVTTAPRDYPDFAPGNTGIYSVSPFSKFDYNTFEGGFVGACMLFEPLQNRAQLLGLTTEYLVGNYSGQVINNNDPSWVTWNNFLYYGVTNQYHFRRAMPRIRYPMSAPPLTFRQSGSFFFASFGGNNDIVDSSTNFNYELVFDNCNITKKIRPTILYGDGTKMFNLPTFVGTYRGMTFINTNVTYGFGRFTKAKVTGMVTLINTRITDSADIASVFANVAPQLFVLNSGSTIVDNTASAPLSVNFSMPNPGTPLPAAAVSLLQSIDTINSFNSTVFVDDQPVSTNFNASKGIFFSDSVQVPWTPGYHKLRTRHVPTYVVINGAFDVPQYSLTFEAGYLTNVLVPFSYAFYLGIDVSEPTTVRRTPLPVLGNSYTRCQWISACQLSGGRFGNFSTALTSISNSTTTVSDAASVSMLTTYYGDDAGSTSSMTLTLPQGYYQAFFYFTNPTAVPAANRVQTTSLPRYSVSINGQFLPPLTTWLSPFQQFVVSEPFLFKNEQATPQQFVIKWGYTGSFIPLAGVEIRSSITTPFPIPNDPITTTTTTTTSTTSTSTTSTTAPATTSTTSTTTATTTAEDRLPVSRHRPLGGQTTTGGTTKFISLVSTITTRHSSSSTLAVNIVVIIISMIATMLFV
ncbi:hypothetical protein SAMD00019534_116520 [Acytostelium subglobosum LB1]|uniref:hypothetical protein n=1 Tax=Acytostelium subglobosum LB1 TaxID=1410327 RepID=UPI000644805D|nr:hypothetical protein SAMD00019534_116520 [Acytostelium subglobosum LB1]GAM28476.1 hypothetical protein SAMD00019534_116520 [Acytostelium subglobosum LB1]|eukprot:XP_012748515.1 hypothetical protein SAMD00019534_116520 [Acytostelium subglobosum LB1]